MGTVQEEIIKEMKVLPGINTELEIVQRVNFIKYTLVKSGLYNLVLGISGGVDSCVCGKLAQIAVTELNLQSPDKVYNFIAVKLPYGVQADANDVTKVMKFIDPTKVVEIDIQDATDSINAEVLFALSPITDEYLPYEKDFAKGNTKARMRMISQYQIAGLVGGLVLGTDHSSENVMGFYTKYGDGACDLAPLFGLNKRQVRQLGDALGAPTEILTKAPTADLEDDNPGLPDEDALGLSYNDIDDYLEGKKVSVEIEEKIINIYEKTTHKRDPIPTIYG